MHFLCLDIGGTNIKYAVISDKLEIISFNKFKTPDSFENLIKKICKLVENTDNLSAVGVGIPGVYDSENDCLIYAPNLEFINEKKIGNEISKQIKLPVFIENDANLAALGEYYVIEKNKVHNFVLITLGTGVGGGAIIHQKLFTLSKQGKSNMTTFEAGHISINHNGRLCGCGRKGCIETYCGINGILKTYEEISGNKAENINMLVKLAYKNDKDALHTFEMYSEHLSEGIASLVNILIPEKIKIGGGLSYYSEFFFEKTVNKLNSKVYPAYKGQFQMEIAKLNNKAGVYGAAALCIEKM